MPRCGLEGVLCWPYNARLSYFFVYMRFLQVSVMIFGWDVIKYIATTHIFKNIKILHSTCLKSTEHTLSVILFKDICAICFGTLTNSTLKIYPPHHTYLAEELSLMTIVFVSSKQNSCSHVDTDLEKITSLCPLFPP